MFGGLGAFAVMISAVARASHVGFELQGAVLHSLCIPCRCQALMNPSPNSESPVRDARGVVQINATASFSTALCNSVISEA